MLALQPLSDIHTHVACNNLERGEKVEGRSTNVVGVVKPLKFTPELLAPRRGVV